MQASAAGAAAYLVLEKALLRRGYGPIETRAFGSLFGALFLALVAAPRCERELRASRREASSLDAANL